jgi:hypothetical protein
MMVRSGREVVVVTDGRDRDKILADKGSKELSLNARRLAACSCILYVHYIGPEYHYQSSERLANSGRCILIGRIDSATLRHNLPHRVEIHKYAKVDVERFWEGLGNNMHYLDESMILAKLNISSFDDLEWRQVADYNGTQTDNGAQIAEERLAKHDLGHVSEPLSGLTVDEAKAGIALRLGVEPANIEITIRA